MVSKQKSIFDKEPVEVLTRREQTKTEDEFVSIDDTIFCQRKVYKEENDEDDEANRFLLDVGEVPLEESIFAKRKKSVSSSFRVPHKETKIDFNEVFNRYKDLYMNEYISNTKRLNMVDANTFNISCMLLEEARKTKFMTAEYYVIVKRVIKSACTCVEDAFYSYTNMNRTLFDLISELYPSMDISVMYNILDRSYAEVIDEFNKNRDIN